MVEQVGVGSAPLGCGFDSAFPSTSNSAYAAAPPLRFATDAPTSSAPGLSKPRMLKQRRRHADTGRTKLKGAGINRAGGSDLRNEGSRLAPGGFNVAENGSRDFVFASSGGSGSMAPGSAEYRGGNMEVGSGRAESGPSCAGNPLDSGVFMFGSSNGTYPSFGRGSSFRDQNEYCASSVLSSVAKSAKLPSDKAASSALSEEMEKKLNIQEPSSNDQPKRNDQGNAAGKDLKSVFVFGATTSNGTNHATNSCINNATRDNGNCATEETMNTANVPVTQLKGTGGACLREPRSVFGEAWKETACSAQEKSDVPNGNSAGEHLADKKNCSYTHCGSEKPESKGQQPSKDDNGHGFIFSSSNNKHATSNGFDVNGISNNTKMRHRNIKKKVVSERRRFSRLSGTTKSNSSSQIHFQVEKPEKGSTYEVASSKPNDCGVPNVPSCPFSIDSVQESLAAPFTAGKNGEEESVAHIELQTPKRDASICSQDNLFSIPGHNLKFCIAIGGSNAKLKKRNKMSKKPPTACQKPTNVFVHRANGSHQCADLDSPGGHSPMDFSPCAGPSDAVKMSNGVASSQVGSVSFGFHGTSNGSPSPMDVGNISNPDDEKLTFTGEADSVLCPNPDSDKHSNFTFAAVHSTSCSLSTTKRHNRRKKQVKVGQHYIDEKFDLSSLASVVFPSTDDSVNKNSVFDESNKKVPLGFSSVNKPKEKEQQANRDPSAASCFAAEACKKWRLRGNQAYEQGQLAKAEEYYTRGLSCISLEQNSRSYISALALCYSNRAATRMALGRMREALSDCISAIGKDPGFLKAKVRAANCHLALGESEEAVKLYKKCQSGNDTTVDVKITKEASDGLLKAQKVVDYIGQVNRFLLHRGPGDLENALNMISKALSISPLSEILIEMKAETLLKLGRYDDVIKVCEETSESAEKNSSLLGCYEETKNSYSGTIWSKSKIWRLYLISKSHFYLGKLEEVLNLISKGELGAIPGRHGDKMLESLSSLSSTVQELLRLKAAGNAEFQAGRYLEATEQYTATLACSVESRPFSAICFCNRAAAYQALGQMADAIADCSLAIALDQNYVKAISRRAALYEVIRNYEQATADLKRLISLLEKKSCHHFGSSGKSADKRYELKQACARLATIQEESKRGRSLNMYMILGVESLCSPADIKKAYRKAALRHHPDKAGQCLVRNENGDDSLWRNVADEVQKDASSLFKMIGEAYAVLSDSTKRMEYDEEESMRDILKKSSCWGSTTRTSGHDQHWHKYYEKNDNGYRPNEQRRSHRSRNQKQSEYHSWSSQYF